MALAIADHGILTSDKAVRRLGPAEIKRMDGAARRPASLRSARSMSAERPGGLVSSTTDLACCAALVSSLAAATKPARPPRRQRLPPPAMLETGSGAACRKAPVGPEDRRRCLEKLSRERIVSPCPNAMALECCASAPLCLRSGHIAVEPRDLPTASNRSQTDILTFQCVCRGRLGRRRRAWATLTWFLVASRSTRAVRGPSACTGHPMDARNERA